MSPIRFCLSNVLFAALLLGAAAWGFTGDQTSVRLPGATENGAAPPDERFEELARWCDSRSMTLEAAITRRRVFPSADYEIALPKRPVQSFLSLPEDAAKEQTDWFDRLRQIQTSSGNELLKQAQSLAREGKGYEAVRVVLRASCADPDNSQIRALFGETLHDGRWRNQGEIRHLEQGQIDHPAYGWVAKEDVPRYESGELLYRGRWLSAEELDRQKKPVAWQIQTDHFKVTASISLPEAVRIGRLLEEFHYFWFFSFPESSMTEKEAAGFVLGKGLPQRKRHQVKIFRNRAEYLTAATRLDPTAVVSSGGYLPAVRSIYIYPSEDPNDTPLETMLFHEATHQLFAESPIASRALSRQRLTAGVRANYWVLESIAVYLETFESLPDRCRAGGTRSLRFVRAKERLREPEGLLPVQKFVILGKEEFQSSSRLPALYTESAGLGHFLFHAGGGRFAPAFRELLTRVYSLRDTPEDIAQLTGLSFEDLDTAFRGYLDKTPFAEE
ncbi:MAG: hypothetical protein IIZ25_05665 [Thermoguttaceae bacterium]|nr:hypothetical protein [Thermoguttaceae bacterium]